MKRILLGLTLMMSCLFTYSQVTVTGSVRTYEDNDVLVGANVVVKGTTIGTITDVDGRFTLEVPSPDAILVFSFIGYEEMEVPLNGRTVIDVLLKLEVIGIQDIVVVGYGVQRKSDVTGSIVSVDADKLRDVPSSDISKAIQGKTAGVEIVNLSRRPGGETQIRVRGSRSLTASNDPLYVVDGIPFSGNIQDIASDDIQSIEVLKDASATVIYGSRGSNGVILITTKRGRTGDVRISYNGFQGITQVAREYNLYDAEGFVKLRSDANNNSYVTDEIESLLTGRETDWQDMMYQTGINSNHEIGISWGSDKTQYMFSVGYYKETGILPGIGFKRYNMRLAIDQKIGDRVRVGVTSLLSRSITDGEDANPMFQILALSPLSKPYNEDGTVKDQPMYPAEDFYSPLTLKDETRWKQHNRRFASFTSFYGEVDIIEGLKYRLNFGYDYHANKYNHFYGSNTPFRDGRVNEARVRHYDTESYTLENLLIYDREFGNHRINFTGMQSIQRQTDYGLRIDANGVPVDYLQYNNFSLAQTVSAPGPTDLEPDNQNYLNEWSLVSFMGRINYAFADRFLVTLTGRADGSSRLAPGNKWHAYPAVAVGWNIVNEAFMDNADFLSNLKLRAGYGQTSNTSIDPYSTLGGITQTVYNFGPEGVQGYYASTLPNANLGWEYTTTTNVGIDFGFLKNRITGSVDAYMQKTNDLLLGKELPPNIGVPEEYLENIGKTENKGFEIVLNGVIFSAQTADDFFWEMNTNLFLNREKIVELQDPEIDTDIGNGWFVGYPVDTYFDWEKIGIWQLGEEDQAAEYSRVPGQVKLKDQDNDGDIDDADRIVVGSAQPDFQGGFTSTWGFKRVDLSVVGYFRVGGMIASTLHMPNNYLNRLDGRRNQIVVDYWTPDNPTNDMPQPSAFIDAGRTDVLGYFDGSFLKIRSINLGFNFNPEQTDKVFGKGSSVRLYVSLADAFLWFSPYLKKGGLDPEPTNEARADVDALDLPERTLVVGQNTPPTRKIIFGVNVKF